MFSIGVNPYTPELLDRGVDDGPRVARLGNIAANGDGFTASRDDVGDGGIRA
jgi:hypothetical protein